MFYPDVYLRSVTALTARRLRDLGIRGLILDVDNTLTTHDNPVPRPDVLRWLDGMRAAGIKMIILSNNSPARVRPFAEILGMDFAADAAKPLPGGYRRAAAKLGLGGKELAVVGDQIFTDVLGGNLCGFKTVLVKPMQPEDTRFFRLKRRLEKGILKIYANNRR